ncbi:MAG TPA: ROK family protein [Patescibacteria group bacterium]|nr:ROK family protein [Patescibacteria group bacterium]
MYLGIDIGGTKTLVAVLDDNGVIAERLTFPTPKDYDDFERALAESLRGFNTHQFTACGVGVPGRIDREHGVGLDMGNLPWHDVPIQADVSKVLGCPVIIDNDANLAGLSEAMLLKDEYSRVLYMTISTGIGTGIIVDQQIDPAFADSEGGEILLEHEGKLEKWESFASGHAIVERYGKKAKDITEAKTWSAIARDLAVGMIDLIAVIQPEVIVLGGGVSTYFDRFKGPLLATLKSYETPLVPIPVIQEAQRPEDAVVYGCYDLAKSTYGTAR